jgi:carbamoyltransferase
VWNEELRNPRSFVMDHAYWGPEYDDEAIDHAVALRRQDLETGEFVMQRERDERVLCARTAEQVAKGNVVGWFQGRMEFGPRALGARSILGDPRSPKMQSQMNLKIKFRESFRPFAPSVLRERVADFFELDADSPYMLLVAPVQPRLRRSMTGEEEKLFGIDKLNVPRSTLPAITHVDYSARVQTVRREDNPLYYDLIAAFGRLTDYPVVVNTSFNVRGEPIVCTPEQAYTCFMRTEMDCLVVGNFVLDKSEQGESEFAEDTSWQEEFQLD